MNPRSVLRNFGYAKESDLALIRDALKLTMQPDALAFCAQYYRNQAGRDPFADELQMLDRLSASLEKDMDAVSPSDLYTNDDFAAETYADLLKNRRLLNPYADYPLSLMEALMTANGALMRAGRTMDLSHAGARVPESLRDHPLSPSENCISAPNAAFRLRVLPPSGLSPRAGDLLVLLTPGHTQTRLQFQKECERLLEAETVNARLQGVYSVHNDGLLRTLLSITNSLHIVLTPFSSLGIPMPMTILTDHYGGCRILRIRPEGQSALMQALQGKDICASAFAKVTSDGRYTFIRGEEDTFSLHPQFLRLLFHRKGVALRLADEGDRPADRIAHRAVTEYNCRYLADLQSRTADDIKIIHDTLATSSSASPTSAYFKTALYATLLPVVTLCTAGADYAKQELSLALEAPECTADPVRAAECLSLILGIYRAQTELGLPAQSITVRTEATLSHPTLTAFTLGSGRAPAAAFKQSGNAIYLLTPDLRENGLPDFRSLRTLLERVTTLAQDGTILSARVLGGESVTDGLRKMTRHIGCKLTDDRIAAEGALPLGILIEAKHPLPEERQVAVTVLSAQKAEMPRTLPDTSSLIWSEVPEIVILARRTDSDAQVLANLLSCRGAAVHLFHPEDGGTDPLSRAILGAQTLILCRRATLPESDRVTFAFETMQRAGGRIISLDPSLTRGENCFSAPEGLSSAILEQICPIKKKNPKKL